MQSVDLTLHLAPDLQIPIPDGVASDELGQEELLSWRVHDGDDDDDLVTFLSRVTGDPVVVREGLENFESVVFWDVTPISERESYVYVTMAVQPADRLLWSVIEGSRLVVVPPVVFADPGTIHVTVVGDQDALSQLLEAFPEGIDVDIERVSKHRSATGAIDGSLTRRQREALETAFDCGYFDVPRTGSLADVADELDVSESAVSTLLRKAERALVETALRR